MNVVGGFLQHEATTPSTSLECFLVFTYVIDRLLVAED